MNELDLDNNETSAFQGLFHQGMSGGRNIYGFLTAIIGAVLGGGVILHAHEVC